MKRIIYLLFIVYLLTGCQSGKQHEPMFPSYSGIYPHLAYYNSEGECGTGAVVNWADRLWVITYGPHLPYGSSDKLYEITSDLQQITRKESIGGTPANRFIHKESNQLFIGPYVIDKERNVKVIPLTEYPGRYTGVARHLSDPANKLYIATMEEGFYEVDVNSLVVKTLYVDGNVMNAHEDDTKANKPNPLLPGAHGKGFYSGQGVVVYSNNGEADERALSDFNLTSGALSEWDGENWKLVRRNQFTEVSGPGGIWGNTNPETDPIWVTGWDARSVLVGVRDKGTWSFYRLPKASNSYDGAHGWNTEWPRIRNVGTDDNPDYLMTMHGMFWRFPKTFSADQTAGIRPRSAYLKVIGDFTRWNDRLVFGCDDSAHKEFLNKRKVKGDIEGPGQSNSNLWFTDVDKPDNLGSTTAIGAVWIDDFVESGEVSEPFLFAGWEKRCAWLRNSGKASVNILLEVDENGNNQWQTLKTVNVPAGQSVFIEFADSEKGEWIRATPDKSVTLSLEFAYTDNERNIENVEIFKGISKINDKTSAGALLYGLGDERRALGVLTGTFHGDEFVESGYYELNGKMSLEKKKDMKTEELIRTRFAIPQNVISIEESSVLIVDDNNRRWRLPLGNETYKSLIDAGTLRICREVATERDLFNCMGTFFELPAENADGFAKIRPVSSHNFRIHDYASYRGLLVMSGLNPDEVQHNSHIIRSSDGKAMLWVGTIDDLWALGKPVGHGGPWKNTQVSTGEFSDPYLIGFYDKKELILSHDQSSDVTFTLEVNPIGHGEWITYKKINVKAGESLNFNFPDSFQARWIRFSVNKSCKATTFLTYK
ncbi:lipoprotein [Bacteroides congonensis]